MDKRVQGVLARIRAACEEHFTHNLIGVYVHGSLAFGCFTWERSDVDFIVVVLEPPTIEEKMAFMQSLLRINRIAPPKGLEMSVVLLRHCRDFIYPTPYELHFSNAHLQRCIQDISAYCRAMHGNDADLAAHFSVIRHIGIRLLGLPIEQVFMSVPQEAYWDSIMLDIQNAREEILRAPVYTVLNLCRALAYRRDGSILSKAQGAAWGIAHLPPEYHPVIRAAAVQYDGAAAVSWPNEKTLTAFAEYMLDIIQST